MAGRILSIARTAPVPAALEIGPFCDSSKTPAPNPLASDSGTMKATASAVGLGCVRGTTLALLFEAVAGLVIYGGWRLFHLLH